MKKAICLLFLLASLFQASGLLMAIEYNETSARQIVDKTQKSKRHQIKKKRSIKSKTSVVTTKKPSSKKNNSVLKNPSVTKATVSKNPSVTKATVSKNLSVTKATVLKNRSVTRKYLSKKRTGVSKKSIARKATKRSKPRKTAREEFGTASFYSSQFNGRKTANGDKFSQKKLTAAHNSVPLGTYLRVTCLKNKRSVIVKVTDRLHKNNRRIVDLSKAAAAKLGNTGKGLMKVKVEILGQRSS